MFHKIICVQTLLFILAGCTGINEIYLQSKTQTRITPEVIPFRYVKKLIVVEAFLNKSDTPSNFIFDTGAFQSKVEHGLAEDLGLRTVASRSNGTAQGIQREIEITSLDSVKFNHSMFGNIAAGKLEYDVKSYSPCVAQDGIIGSNLIKLANWKIDYQTRTIEISSDPIGPASEDFYAIPYKTSFMSGVPLLTLRIQDVQIEEVILDLGYNGGVVLPKRYAEKFTTGNAQRYIDQSTSGIFGSNRDTLVVKELELLLGTFSAKIPVEFSSLNKALIGNDFLEHFAVYLQTEEDQILLEPVSQVVIDQHKTFIPGILNDSLWVVNRVSPGLPVQIGDTLRSMDGLIPRDVFPSHCDYFMGIHHFLEKDSLKVQGMDGTWMRIDP